MQTPTGVRWPQLLKSPLGIGMVDSEANVFTWLSYLMNFPNLIIHTTVKAAKGSLNLLMPPAIILKVNFLIAIL